MTVFIMQRTFDCGPVTLKFVINQHTSFVSIHFLSNHQNEFVSLQLTAALAKWLRCPPRERQIQSSIPACAESYHIRISTETGWPGVSIL